MIQIPKLRADDSRTLTIERSGKPNERFTVEIDETLINGGFYDLARDMTTSDKRLKRGAVYKATLGHRKMTFKVDAKARTGTTPVVSRLLRFPPG